MFAGGEDPTDADEEDALYEVWLENQPAVELFLDVATQWRVVAAPEGTAGMVSAIWSRIMYTGLDYTAVAATLAMRRIPRRRHAGLLSDLQVMERAALDEMRILRESESAR